MENTFNKNAIKPTNNVYVVFTENMVDSLCATEAVKTHLHSAANDDANIYFVDGIDVVYLEQGSDMERYTLNVHGYSQADYKKACYIFNNHLEEKYNLDSTCLTSEYSGGLQMALFSMFENEAVDNVVVVVGEGMEAMVRDQIDMARGGPKGMKKHVEFEVVQNETPSNKAIYSCVKNNCPNITKP